MANGVLPDLEEFCLKVPLYKKFNIYKGSYQTELIHKLHVDEPAIDCFCIDCVKSSIFNTKRLDHFFKRGEEYFNVEKNDSIYLPHIFERDFLCSRNINHTKPTFLFMIHDTYLMKIGQYPSMADLSKPEIQKYRKILGDDLFKEFNCAVGLVSHGVGIGAFVYLRRIFEKEIEQAHEEAKRSKTWNDDKYRPDLRMDEKILLLKEYLPKFLVTQRKIYNILSIGIHELHEQECLDNFPVMKLGIEMILDEKLRQKEREEKIKQAGVKIEKSYEELKVKDEGNDRK